MTIGRQPNSPAGDAQALEQSTGRRSSSKPEVRGRIPQAARELLHRSGVRWLVLAMSGLLVVVVFTRFVPYCMDEFLQYNEIIYGHYPNNNLNVFNEAPGLYDLNVYNTGVVLPLRCYYYMGVVPAIVYYPLFLVWQHPMSARFSGILLLIVQAALLARIVRFRVEYLFLGLLIFFPYLFQHLVETGLVGLQIACLLGTYLLLRRWFDEPTWRRALGMAVLVFLGIWTKLSFLWYAPALTVIAAGFAWDNRRRPFDRRRLVSYLRQGAAAVAVLLILLSVLFLATDPGNPERYPYWEQLFGSDHGPSHSVAAFLDLEGLRSLPVFDTLWNPWRAAERVFDPPSEKPRALVYSFVLYAAAPLLWIILIVQGWPESRSVVRRSALTYAGFWLTVLMIFLSKEAWAMHHTVLAYPFLILGFLISLEGIRDGAMADGRPRNYRRTMVIVMSVLLVTNGYYFVSLPSLRIDPENHPSRIALNARLADGRLAGKYIYVVLDWGMYFYQALYGHRDQSVLYVAPLTPPRARALAELKTRTGRKLLFLYHPRLPGHDLQALRRQFRVVPCDLTGKKGADGDDWLVLIEEEGADDVCL